MVVFSYGNTITFFVFVNIGGIDFSCMLSWPSVRLRFGVLGV